MEAPTGMNPEEMEDFLSKVDAVQGAISDLTAGKAGADTRADQLLEEIQGSSVRKK